MRRRVLLIATGSVVGVAVVAGGGLYAYISLSNRDAPPPVALSTPSAPAAVGSAVPGAPPSTGSPAACATGAIDGAWTVAGDGQSFAGYRVTEKLASLPARSDAVGRTPAVTGSMTIAGTTVSAATFTADLTKLSSNEARRDNFIRHDGLQSSTFPTAMFVLAQPMAIGGVPTPGQAVSATAHGAFSLHGVARTVDIPLQAQRTCAGIEVVGSLPVTFSDYGMSAPSIGGFVSVDDHGTMEVRLELVRAA